MRAQLVVCLGLLPLSLSAAQPRLVLGADRSTAGVGEPILVTVSVADAPAFACFGATLVMPASGLAVSGQAAGAATWVRDSRERLVPGVRFGGYAHTDRPAGGYVLGRITVRASAPGTYTVRAPSFSAAEPFGGLLLPVASAARVVPTGAELVLTITGSQPRRAITLQVPPAYEWVALEPDGADVSPPVDGQQTITLGPWQTAVVQAVPVPGVSG